MYKEIKWAHRLLKKSRENCGWKMYVKEIKWAHRLWQKMCVSICSHEKTNLSVIWLSLNRSQCGSVVQQRLLSFCRIARWNPTHFCRWRPNGAFKLSEQHSLKVLENAFCRIHLRNSYTTLVWKITARCSHYNLL